jgi:hypothetical protein
MTWRVFLGGAFLVLTAAGCDCGEDRDRDRDREPASAEPAKAARPALDAQTAPAPPKRNQPAAPPAAGRFGTASITFEFAEGRPRVKVRIAIPEGATVPDGETLRAAVYFDNGPPIAAHLTAGGGFWQSAALSPPAVVATAERTVLRISTTPQTTFAWETSGAFRTAEGGPVTLDTGH